MDELKVVDLKTWKTGYKRMLQRNSNYTASNKQMHDLQTPGDP
jgi:hypothetical protein